MELLQTMFPDLRTVNELERSRSPVQAPIPLALAPHSMGIERTHRVGRGLGKRTAYDWLYLDSRDFLTRLVRSSQ